MMNGVQSRQVEQSITEYPEYQELCLRTSSGNCSQIFSFATFMHTSPVTLEANEVILQEECVLALRFRGGLNTPY
jgi:hypothetical protein